MPAFEHLEARIALDVSSNFSAGMLQIWLENHDAVEVSSDTGFVKIGTTTTQHLASAVETIVVFGGSGDNQINLGAVGPVDFTSLTSTTIFGGSGNDSIVGSALGDIILGGLGNDTLIGNSGDDLLMGDEGNDSLVGGLGDDVYVFGDVDNGNDIVVEASFEGQDWLEFSSADAPLRLCLDKSAEQFWGAGSITLTNPAAVENLVGTAYADMICGNDADNILLGSDGDDTLVGFAGNDLLSGDFGDDALAGGDGNDMLIGGEGSDFLPGDFGEDLVVAADLAFPNLTIETLQDIQAVIDVLMGAWTAPATLAERLANLEGAPGASNPVAEPYRLLAGQTVLDDADVDLLPATLDQDVLFLDTRMDLVVQFPANTPVFRDVDPAFVALTGELLNGVLTIAYHGTDDVVYSVEDGFLKVNGSDPLAAPLTVESILQIFTQAGRLAGQIDQTVLYTALPNLEVIGYNQSAGILMPEMTAQSIGDIYSGVIGPDWTTLVELTPQQIADAYNAGQYGILFEILCEAGVSGASQSMMMQSSSGAAFGSEELATSDIWTDDLAYTEAFLTTGRESWWKSGDKDAITLDTSVNWWSWWQKWRSGSYTLGAALDPSYSIMATEGGGGGAAAQADGPEGGTLNMTGDAEPVNEGDWAKFKIRLDADYHNGFTVDFHTVNGSATGGGNYVNGDYQATQGTYPWGDGGEGDEGIIEVQTFIDYRIESEEKFTLQLTDLQNVDGAEGNVLLGTSSGEATILDTTTPPVASVGSATTTEGNTLLIPVFLSHPHQDESVTVNWTAEDITAEAGADYSPTSGSLIFEAFTESSPGQTVQYIHITTVDDSVAEYTEEFNIRLTGGINVQIPGGEETNLSFITDNDPDPILTVEDVTVTEGGAATFTLTLSAASEKEITVTYSTSSGTAVAPGDYTALPATQITIAPGTTTREITVQTIDDDIPEPTQYFTLNVGNGVNVAFLNGAAGTSATGNIDDNDPLLARVKSVAFAGTGAITIKQDPLAVGPYVPFTFPPTLDGIQYSAPHYLDVNHNGTHDEPNDRRYPVAYVRNSIPTLTVSIWVEKNEFTGPYQISGQGGWNIDLPSTPATASDAGENNGSLLVSTTITSTNPLPDQVDYLETLTIDWRLKVAEDGEWIASGTSSQDDAYLTLAPPKPTAPVYHTVIHIGSMNASGKTSEEDTFGKIWDAFDTLQITNRYGNPLHYYKKWDIYSHTVDTLLAYHDGRCQAWVLLMRNVMAVQGIGGEIYVVIPIEYHGMLIPNWNPKPQVQDPFNLTTRWDGSRYTYLNDSHDGYQFDYADLDDGNGVAGQNNNNPEADFANHALIKYDGKFYDPSYGEIWNNEEHFDSMVFGYYFVHDFGPAKPVDEVGYGKDLNQDGVIQAFAPPHAGYLLLSVIPNNPNRVEVRFAYEESW